MSKTKGSSGERSPDSAKAERLKAALRANLQRRKAQGRARAEESSETQTPQKPVKRGSDG